MSREPHPRLSPQRKSFAHEPSYITLWLNRFALIVRNKFVPINRMKCDVIKSCEMPSGSRRFAKKASKCAISCTTSQPVSHQCEHTKRIEMFLCSILELFLSLRLHNSCCERLRCSKSNTSGLFDRTNLLIVRHPHIHNVIRVCGRVKERNDTQQPRSMWNVNKSEKRQRKSQSAK